MEELYIKYNYFCLKVHEIQVDKIFSTLQKIFEFSFNKVYQKTKENINIQKYSILFTKIISNTIKNKTNLSSYISPGNDSELVINSNYYCKFLSKK